MSGEEKNSQTGNATNDDENYSKSSRVEKDYESGSTSNIYGYRIQIGLFEDINKSDADRMADYARSRVDVNVYIEFEAPFYRVQIGDFTKKNDAEYYLKILKRNNFKDVLLIRTTINIP